MKVLSFAVLSTDGHFEFESHKETLRDWTFIDISLTDHTQQNIKLSQASPPTKVMIRDRMLFLWYN